MVASLEQIHLIFTSLDQLAKALAHKPFILKTKKGARREQCYFTWLIRESLLEILILHVGPITIADQQVLALRSKRLNDTNCSYFGFHQNYCVSVDRNPIPQRINKPYVTANHSFSCLHHKVEVVPPNPYPNNGVQRTWLLHLQRSWMLCFPIYGLYALSHSRKRR